MWPSVVSTRWVNFAAESGSVFGRNQHLPLIKALVRCVVPCHGLPHTAGMLHFWVLIDRLAFGKNAAISGYAPSPCSAILTCVPVCEGEA